MPVGTLAGESNVKLTIANMPSHSHVIARPKWYTVDDSRLGSYGSIFSYVTVGQSGTTIPNAVHGDGDIKNTGGGQAHNNMPPFRSVFIWRRTA